MRIDNGILCKPQNGKYDEVMPWDHLDYYISKEFLVRENKKARAAQTTEHCRNKCSACGVSREIGRACFE